MSVAQLGCPINRAIAALADKWKILIILSLQERTLRYGELLKILDGIAPKVMARQLRSLEKDGLVHRRAYAQVPPRVEYSLTVAGRSLLPILNDLQRWAMANSAQLPAIAGDRDYEKSKSDGCSESGAVSAINTGESFRTLPTAAPTG